MAGAMSQDQIIACNFILLTLLVFTGIVSTASGGRTRGCIVGWLLGVGGLSYTKVLTHFEWPLPPAPLVFITGLSLTIWLGFSSLAQGWLRLSLNWLVGFQGFRLLVELLLLMGCEQGLVPQQLTLHGLNYDMLTGISALALAPIAHRLPQRWLRLWNTLGMMLLLWVILLSAVSFPTPLQLLKPDNAWMLYFPYVWLPAGLLPAALLGHLILLRRLR
jgi:hypothetical protein